MNILEKLDKEITQQTRNGRSELYISTDDLEALGMSKFETSGRVWIKIEYLKKLINRYKNNIENTPEQIMQRRNEESWEK